MPASARSRIILAAAAVLVAGVPAVADRPSLLKMFSRDARTAQPVGGELHEEDGPFMILAHTMVGEGAKDRAGALAVEIRREMNKPVFIHKEDFDFTRSIGYDAATSRHTRYANPSRYEAYAVLVGEYDRVDHPDIDADLAKIKAMRPVVLSRTDAVEAETDDSNPATKVKNITATILRKTKGDDKRMSHAFVTRNPMLPAGYFEAPQVDAFVRDLNDGLPNSLLGCKSRYTVVVKTFQGRSAMVDGRQEKAFKPNARRMGRMAEKADEMCRELREQGVEAYQYHDRYRSLVCVGSFDSLGTELPGGKFQYDAGIRDVMAKYNALNVRPELAGQVPAGARGVAARAVAMVPFDVEPKPIAVPRVSRKSLYGLRR